MIVNVTVTEIHYKQLQVVVPSLDTAREQAAALHRKFPLAPAVKDERGKPREAWQLCDSDYFRTEIVSA